MFTWFSDTIKLFGLHKTKNSNVYTDCWWKSHDEITLVRRVFRFSYVGKANMGITYRNNANCVCMASYVIFVVYGAPFDFRPSEKCFEQNVCAHLSSCHVPRRKINPNINSTQRLVVLFPSRRIRKNVGPKETATCAVDRGWDEGGGEREGEGRGENRVGYDVVRGNILCR